MGKEIKLNRQQQKWFKKHKHKLGAEEIAHHLNLSRREIDKLLGTKEAVTEPLVYEKYALAALLGVAFLVLATSWPNQFVSDDIPAILNNPLITSWSNVTLRLTGSLQNLIYFLLTNIFGIVPWPLRLMSILFHLLTAGLLYAIVRRTQPFVVAWLASALFVLAPVTLEPVIWISGISYVLGGFMTMWCLYLHFDDQRTPYKDWLEIITWSLALITTEKFIFIPILLLIWDWRKNRLPRTGWLLAALLTISLIRGLGLLAILGRRVESLQAEYYNSTAGQVDSPLSKVLIAIGYYLYLYAWPKDLTLYHSEVSLGWQSLVWYGSLSLVFALAVGLSGRRKDEWWFWGAFLVTSMIPALLPFGVSSLVAERYAYLGYAGVAVLISGLVFQVMKRKALALPIKIFVGIALMAMIGRSLNRIQDWRTADHLWLAAAKSSPHSWQNHNNLGDVYSNQGEYQKAIQEFSTAIDLNPRYADAIHNRANAYLSLGETDLAKAGFQAAAEINPKLWQSRIKLAEIAVAEKNWAVAIEEVMKAQLTNKAPEIGRWLGVLEEEARKAE